ncbi:MAG: cation-translocating P-type ATPase [Candidatus Absconditabacterales bacterium]
MVLITEEEVKKLQGLSTKEVNHRIAKDGYNELPSTKKKHFLQIIWDVIQEPMLLLLIACGTLYLFLGDTQEAIILLSSIVFIIGLSIYQENKTERAIEALKDLSSPRALVIRNGEQIRIPGREVVKDDIIILNEGDKVPADCLVLWSRSCSIDESLLTGESVPVRKSASEKISYTHFRPGGDDQPFVFSGTMMVQGQCVVKVLSIGIQTEMGRIGKALSDIKTEKTTLQKEVRKVVAKAFIIAVALCFIVFLAYGIINQDRIQGLLSGLSLAMGILPEEFPIVLTIFLAIGAWRMSKKNILTRKMAAVETLGAATVLCSDKTGTITWNKMTVKKLYTNDKFFDIKDGEDITESFHKLVEYGILASKKDPFDPMEKALINLGHNIDSEHIHDFTLIQEYPLTKQLLALSHVWKEPGTNHVTIASKGAPEAIIELCNMDSKQKKEIMNKFESMAKEGLRVLGVAKASFHGSKLPTSQTELKFEFIGLIGWIDPIRETVPQAIKECYNAGIRVIMITGDYPTTAQYIAKEIGLRHPEYVILGEELTSLSEKELLKKIEKANILARVAPEEKLIIINLLKKQGHFVAMTGDGVNDAPALKSAHIGIAMGQRGTDVARESSAIVLLDDDFSSIVHGIRTGRKIFDNLKKAMIYIVSVHIPYAGLIVLPIFLGRPIILYPIHVVFMELIIDPACSIIFEGEKEEANIMSRLPRDPKESLFGKRTLFFSVLQGLFVLFITLIIHRIFTRLGQSEVIINTASFITLVIGNLSLILVNRSWTHSIIKMFSIKNIALFPILIGTLICIIMMVYIPAVANIFHFTSMGIRYFLLAIVAGFSSVLRFEIVKLIARKRGVELLKD